MKAAVSASWGGPEVIQIKEVPTPEPGPNQLLIKIHAATVSRTDDGMLRPIPKFARLFMGLRRPRLQILGMDFAGEVVKTGAAVTRFNSGDRVFGLSTRRYGAHAEYLCVEADSSVARIPDGVAFDQAVVCEGAWYANNNLRQMEVNGGKILVYGASGAVGTSAVQLACHRGAEVTAVVETRHVELARSLGAHRVIDYTQEDFTALDERFDYILDAVGKTSYFRCRRLLKSGGRFGTTEGGPWMQNFWLVLWFRLRGTRRVVLALPAGSQALVELMAERLAQGEFRGVFDKRYRLDDIADAYRYVASAQKTGIVRLDLLA